MTNNETSEFIISPDITIETLHPFSNNIPLKLIMHM